METSEELCNMNPRALQGADVVPEVKMVALVRVIEKSEESMNANKKAGAQSALTASWRPS